MSKEQIWIEAGYQTFAFEGPQALRIEKLAKSVGKNKSSFYHFFSDLEVFTERLLDFHLIQAKVMSDKESNAQNEAELTQTLLDHKLDLLFNRQLRIHRDNADFQTCFLKTNEISLKGFMPIWKKVIDLQESNHLANMVLMLSIENFFLQITDETLNSSWISAYFSKIKEMVQLFKTTNSIPSIDGSV
jgi:AcrR family transcriptional regulator